MADEPENLTLRLLQEMRVEMREMRSDLTERMEDMAERMDGLANQQKGTNLLMTMVSGLVHDHEQRIDKLESR